MEGGYDTYRFAYSLESPDPNLDEPVAMSSSLPLPFKKVTKALLAKSVAMQPQLQQTTGYDQEQVNVAAAGISAGVADGGTGGAGPGPRPPSCCRRA